MTRLDTVRPPTNATEERLLDAALTLFAQKGYEATSVREIINAVGVTAPVLYYYCSGKDDLFKRLVRWKHDQAYQELGQILGSIEGCADRLRAIARGSFRFCLADLRVPRLMFQTSFGPSIPGISEFMDAIGALRFEIVRQVMLDGLDQKALRGGDAGALALMFCSILDTHLHLLTRIPDARDRLRLELADELVNAFLYGIGTGRRGRVALPPFSLG
ncbi:TetR/AcrR family transcriptional regulator [Tautonia marina]|uniref:TetR/AcrR family transcriptional regulator n=1 Tax=Tautonia marina TaxID=2653855 RepID=UPI00137570AD|nr:TetR/AcrR family transcriptional regulator [Tautonia marina]